MRLARLLVGVTLLSVWSSAGRAGDVRVHVRMPDGSPAAGAVVLSLMGNEAVTDASGFAEIELDAGSDPAHRISAAWTRAGQTYFGTAELDPSEGGVVTTITLVAGASCQPEWLPTFGGAPGTDGVIYAMAVFDDGSGSGPALYVGGDFDVAGGVSAHGVARWDGERWAAVGSGTIRAVRAMTVFDDGSGEALYVGGDFATIGGVSADHVARWDGADWSAVGDGMEDLTDPDVYALAVFDDGLTGPTLYAAGEHYVVNGPATGLVSRWIGGAWMLVEGGPDRVVRALASFDDGSGPALYAGGDFEAIDGAPAPHVARWNGAVWSAVGAGFDDDVLTLAAYNDGGGPALYAGGRFTASGGSATLGIARWSGVDWTSVGGGVDGDVRALHVHDDGSGPGLYAAGGFVSAGGVPAGHVARWDGAGWSALSGGVGSLPAEALAVFDDGQGGGAQLFTAGAFFNADGARVNRIAAWDGASWSAIGRGDLALGGNVRSLAVFDDGSGPALYVGGSFVFAGDIVANNIARWDGAVWTALGSGVDGAVQALAVYDDGFGPALFVGGAFQHAGGVAASNIARWDGASWSPLGDGVFGEVLALTVFDDGDGPGLIAAGMFGLAGGVPVNRVARWRDGQWSAIGFGLTSWVQALGVFDSGLGAGPELYIGGAFTVAQGSPADRLARWNGVGWSSVGAVNGTVYTIATAHLADGPAMYIGGAFSAVNGQSALGLARWDGAAWSGLPNPGSANALLEYDDGTGRKLYALGTSYLGAWNGATWTNLGASLFSGGGGGALGAFDDGSGTGPALYVGGSFTASPAGDSYLARRTGCAAPPCPGDLNGDGVVDFADLDALLEDFNTTGPNLPGDTDDDGDVDFADLNTVVSAFNTVCP